MHSANSYNELPNSAQLKAEPQWEILVCCLLWAIAYHFAFVETQSIWLCIQRWGNFMLKTYSFSYTASASTKAGIWTVPHRYSPSIISIKYRPPSICISQEHSQGPQRTSLWSWCYCYSSDLDQIGSLLQKELGLSSWHCCYYLRKAQPCW